MWDKYTQYWNVISRMEKEEKELSTVRKTVKIKGKVIKTGRTDNKIKEV